MKTKLEIIREALEMNPNVIVGAIYENTNGVLLRKEDYIENHNSCYSWDHFVHIHVAPKERLSTNGKLEDFMMGLIPNLNPSNIDHFYGLGGRGPDGAREIPVKNITRPGQLYFDEKIGERIIDTKVTWTLNSELCGGLEGLVFNKDYIKDNFPDNSKIFVNQLRLPCERRTIVVVHPCAKGYEFKEN